MDKAQPTARVQPTAEFLKREGSKPTAAAESVNCFLPPNTHSEHRGVKNTTEQQPFLLSVPTSTPSSLALFRPRREKAGEARGHTAKLTANYLESLLGNRASAELEVR